jgi:hypothetical protein
MNQSKQVNEKEPQPPTITVNEALPATPKLTSFQIRSAKAKHALQAIRNSLNS